MKHLFSRNLMHEFFFLLQKFRQELWLAKTVSYDPLSRPKSRIFLLSLTRQTRTGAFIPICRTAHFWIMNTRPTPWTGLKHYFNKVYYFSKKIHRASKCKINPTTIESPKPTNDHNRLWVNIRAIIKPVEEPQIQDFIFSSFFSNYRNCIYNHS